MRVLLLSQNRVVRELVKLGVKEVPGAELEIADGADLTAADRYDLILVDDRILKGKEVGLEHLLAARRVLLGEETGSETFDTIIAKPFLPEDIRRLLERKVLEPEEQKREGLHGFFEEETAPEVLDEEELRRIRQLLDGEAEIKPEEESLPAPLKNESWEDPGGVYSFEAFLELLQRQKIKRLKKLLGGATVEIKIHFPKEC